MAAKDHAILAGVNVSDGYPVVAGFQVSINGRSWVSTEAIAQQFRVSRRTIERIAQEAKIPSDADGIIGRDGAAGRRPGRRRVTEAIRARGQALLLEDAECPPGKVCRLLRRMVRHSA